jgi:uncharacterized repeat protein (TIGR02543 family)
MADNINKSWKSEKETAKNGTNNMNLHDYAFSDINTWVASNIPPYSQINSATLDATADKDPNGSLKTGTLDVGLHDGSDVYLKYVLSSKRDLNYSGVESITGIDILKYIRTKVSNSGYMVVTGYSSIRVWSGFTALYKQGWKTTAKINYNYNEPRAIVSVSKSGEGTVKVYNNSGTEVSSGSTHHYNNKYTIKAEATTGWKFVKWSDGDTNASRTFTVNADFVQASKAYQTSKSYQAIFEPITYTITLNNQSATSAGTSTIYLKYSAGWYSNSAATTSISSITIPQKTGHTFGGYYTSTNGAGTQIINSSGVIVGSKTYIAENDTLYAYWIKNTYSIHFNSNGGIGSIQSQTNIAYDISINLTINNGLITKIGYNFSGWNTKADGSGTSYANGASVSKLAGSSKTGDSITLYAQWTTKTPLVTFEPNGGFVSPTSKSVTYGQSYGTLPTPMKNHYDFLGWYYKNEEIISSTIVNEENAHTLIASWTPKTYILNFDARGGTVNPTSKEVTYNSKYGELPTP